MIILLTGEDTFRSQRRLEQLRDAFRKKHDSSGMNTVMLDGQTAAVEDLRAAVNTQGFFSAKRFVALNRWQPTGPIPSPDLIDISRPFTDSRDVIVVIRMDVAKKASGKSAQPVKKTSTLKIPGSTVEAFDPLTEEQLRVWITGEAKRRQGQISLAATRELMIRVGRDLWRMHHELEKLLAYVGDRTVTPEDVAELVPAPEITDMFALTDAVGQQRQAAALQLLEREMSAGTHPLAIVSLLANHIATLRAVQRHGRQAPATVAQSLGLHPYVVKKAQEQSGRFNPESLATWHHRLVSIDATLKSTPLDAATLLDVLIAAG